VGDDQKAFQPGGARRGRSSAERRAAAGRRSRRDGDGNGRPPAGGFTFGVCAATDTTDAICKRDPNTVPKVMDTITPPGVSQATELNPTLGPVELQGVSP
jgi:hypothetical protein